MNRCEIQRSGMSDMSQFGKKPLNPVLGETYRCRDSVSGFLYVGEQVSHHPPISAYHFVHELHDMSFSGEGEGMTPHPHPSRTPLNMLWSTLQCLSSYIRYCSDTYSVFAKFGGNYVAAGLSGRSILRLGRKRRENPRPFLEGATRLYRLPLPLEDASTGASEEQSNDKDQTKKKKKKKKSSKHSKDADSKHSDEKDTTAKGDAGVESGGDKGEEEQAGSTASPADDAALEHEPLQEKKATKSKKKEKSREGYSQEGPWDREAIDEYVFDPALPTGYARGLIFGRQHNEIGGPMQIYCPQSGLIAKLQFKLAVR